MIKRAYILVALIIAMVINAAGQTIPDGYNPFVPANLNDPMKLQLAQVVESSFHRYRIEGDSNYTDPSTFVWYVENGEFGTYDTIIDVWTPLPAGPFGLGDTISLTAIQIDGVNNCSEIWVRWDFDSGGKTGYVAAYEKSILGCIEENEITGYKHEIVDAPEIWFTLNGMEVCSNDSVLVSVTMNDVNSYSYPYRVSLRFPDNDGIMRDSVLVLNDGDLSAFMTYNIWLPSVRDINVAVDEDYLINIIGLRDRYGSVGFVAPHGASANQYSYIELIVNHLPQTEYMAMDGKPAVMPLPGLMPVVLPDPGWALDSVVNGSVHRYTVRGDRYYASPSDFVWTVYGGTLYLDEAATQLAGDGTTVTLDGTAGNVTELYVAWDKFTTARDTGYVYVYEISADGCQNSDDYPAKYRGMRIKVSAPPDVRFLLEESIVCSYNDSVRVVAEIEGMPPYDLYYSINGTPHHWYITAADLSDLDGDGEADNFSFFHSGFTSITTDVTFNYEIDSVSSGGVAGHVIDFSSHLVYARALPPAPEIDSTYWRQITVGHEYIYELYYPGLDPQQWFWEIRDEATNLALDHSSTSNSDFPVILNSAPGFYDISVYYIDQFGCVSPSDQVRVELFDIPTIQFVDNDTIINCSATTLVPDEIFQLEVRYSGALSYGYTYEIYDYNNTVVGGGEINDETNWTTTITIENNFINDALPEEIRPWRVVIKSAHTVDSRVNVNILDSDIAGGRDEKVILIYPKPLVQDDIDFAN